jgi:hypothetical protein
MSTEKLVITPEEKQRIEALRDALGIPKTAEKLGMNKDTILRILASAPVHRGTVLVLREALAKLNKEVG